MNWYQSSNAIATYGKPLCVIILASSEQSLKRVISRNHKASEVGEELASKIKDNEEEVKGDDADNSIGLRHTKLLLEIVESRIFGELETH